MSQIFTNYLTAIERELKTGNAKEHTYRPHIKTLLESLDKNIIAINEPARGTFGAPDFIIKNKDIPVGYIETKDIGVNRLDNLHGYETEQLERYRNGLNNLIYTDYLDFIFYKDGNVVSRIRIADFDGKTITPKPENFAALENLLLDFFVKKSITIKSASKLAELMAGKAKLVADVIRQALENGDTNTSLHDQLKAFQNILIHDIKPTEFADVYAQTIAYGMFAARLHDSTLGSFTRAEAASLIPKTNPFLRNLFGYVAGNDIDQRIVWVVDSLAEIFSYTDVADIMRDFGRQTKTTDPIIHFYETFLTAYNPTLRKSRGVFYTPQPVVDYIVRAVDSILKTDFGLPMGLADTSKITKKVDTQGTNKPINKEFHRVQLLDPATGTGTFLAETIRFIHKSFENNAGLWTKYVDEHLLPRVHGFELLMASYAMAHLKLDLVLRETGYVQDDAPINEKLFRQDDLFDNKLADIGKNAVIRNTNQRLGIYLTNSLEEADPNTQTLFFAQWLSNEAREANNIKRDTPVMCVIGNPPYSGESSNKSDYIMNLMDSYKKEPGGLVKLKERNPKWINDDYVKFIRLAEHFIEKNKNGVVAYINNNGFLDNPTFRGMRWHLLNTFDKCYILNLHGNSKKKETSPDGSKDENVFDIMVGTSINIFVKTGNKKKSALAKIYYKDVWGKRDSKYNFLIENDLHDSDFKEIISSAPNYFFVPKNNSAQTEYDNGFSLPDLFPLNSVGIVTARDDLAIQYTKTEVDRVINDFANLPIETARQKYNLGKDARDWSVKGAQEDLNYSELDKTKIVPISYRVFDTRYTYYTGNSKGFQCMARARAMQHIINNNNLIILLERIVGNKGKPYNDVFICNNIWDAHNLGSACYGFPLYTYFGGQQESNLDPRIVKQISESIGRDADPLEIFDYIYAVLHSPFYREKYREFLKIDFPRIPFPTNASEFERLAALGSKLRKLHLMKSVPASPATYPVSGDDLVDKIVRDGNRVYINKTQYFDNVSDTAWEFFIGGYQPAQKWLKDRRGRTLSFEDIMHYQKIIAVLLETDNLMQQIG